VDLDRLALAPKIALPAIVAIAAFAVLEVVAYFGFQESSAERNAFGFSDDAAVKVTGSVVSISAAASRAFWTQRYPKVAPPGTKRIVLVGDSAARGPSLERSVSEALRRLLVDRHGIRAEVWNLSSPGYGSRRKAIVVHKALEFHPDLVIYDAGVSTEYEDSREWDRYLEYHSWHPRHWVDQLPFLGRMRMSKLEKLYWQWLPEEVRAASLEDPLEARIAAISSKSDTRYWTPLMLSNLDRTVDEVRRSGAQMLILVHSHLDPRMGQVDDSGLDKTIAARYAPDAGVAVASSRELLSSHADVNRLFSDPSHWTDAGKEVIARGLVEPAFRLLNGADSLPRSHHAGRSERGAPGGVADRQGEVLRDVLID
jgi:hypothetical protein